MADTYSVILARTASTTLPIGSLTASATAPVAAEIVYLAVACTATPAEARYGFRVQRCTSAGTSTAVTPTVLGYGWPGASSLDAGEDHTVAPALTSGAILLEGAFHQRATFQFYAPAGRGLGLPAIASAGVAFLTPSGPASAVVLTCHYSEGLGVGVSGSDSLTVAESTTVSVA